ncbi:hypothetical protein Mgra_00007000 [Meloidogyne graminicola]|uniref:Uncharacterized protein n=1 Tax=Meloidogyne graminicola TaxID=189291 RepID=A0A8S9ZJQ7_9BILA|nr:hypothetical protein Mgra_00007000 [Meloidogyne graminicola]
MAPGEGGGIKKKELDMVCELEWRKFDWSIMPNNVRSSQFFSWKIFILAQIYAEFDTFIWCDTSITFQEVNALNPLFDYIENGTISPVILPSGMYEYLPLITDWVNASKSWDSNMYEANLLIFHKSEYTRKFLKWALLCASTLDCIEPLGSVLYCNMAMSNLTGVCHRQDQSVFNILNVNFEYQR